MATKALARRRPTYFARPRHRSKAKMTVSLALLAGLAPTAAFAIEGFRIGGTEGGIVEAMHRITMRLTGYEWKGGGFSSAQLMMGWTPLLMGGLAHMAANRLGINRMMSRAGIPFIRI